jgi:hypothetical protein
MSKPIENLSDRELLEEVYEQQIEQGKKINSIHKRYRFQFIFGIFKWIIYIGLAVGLYAYLQPFIENITNTYSNLQESAETIGELRAKLPQFPTFSF